MAQFPPLPSRNTIPYWIWNVLDKIITFCKSLTIKGDGKTIKVSSTDGGYVISAINNSPSPFQKSVYFLEVTELDAVTGCPATYEWHKYTIQVLSDEVVDPPDEA